MIISVGEFMKFFRKRNKLSQEQVADILGCTVKGLSKIENGVSSPRAYTIGLFEDFFKVKISRYYQRNTEMLPLSSYETLERMLESVGNGDIKGAYNIACEFESSAQARSKECQLNIQYVKARFFAAIAGNYGQAVERCVDGLKYEDYVTWQQDDKVGRPLVIESFLPSVSALQLINFLGLCLFENNEREKSVAVFEEVLSSIDRLFNEPKLLKFCYSREEVCNPYCAICNNLAHACYAMGEYEKSLSIAEKGALNNAYFGISPFKADLHYIKFKALCALGRDSEALQILPDVFFLYRGSRNPVEMLSIKDELAGEFPRLSNSINTLFNMWNALYTMYATSRAR
jgi:transcriptional regulator with XRE-family HTH domain